MPLTTRCSTISSSLQMMVPSGPRFPAVAGSDVGRAKLDSTRTRILCTMASSTERVCSTLEPSEAISSISS